MVRALRCVLSGSLPWPPVCSNNPWNKAARINSVLLTSKVDDAGKQQLAKDMEKGRHLGTIRVRVYRSSYTKHNKISSHAPTPITLAEGREVSIAEKALKVRRPRDLPERIRGIWLTDLLSRVGLCRTARRKLQYVLTTGSHTDQPSLSPVTYHKKGGTTRSYRNVDGNENPVAIFHFKYRSRGTTAPNLFPVTTCR